VFGGDGIEPDEATKTPELNEIERDLADMLFFFARDAVYGHVDAGLLLKTGFTKTSTSYGGSVTDENLFRSFENYVRQSPVGKFSTEQIRSEQGFIVNRLKFDLFLALRGEIEANRFTLSTDRPVQKALTLLPKARELALAGLDQ
jgi:hypothetical protein